MPELKETAPEKVTDSPTTTPRKSVGRMVPVSIYLLEGETLDLQIDRKAKGSDLHGLVCEKLDLVEKDYFGLLYTDRHDERNWLDLEKRVSKFMRNEPWCFRFQVKFYPPEPSQLKEEITRYYLVLQIRNDILERRLPCSFITLALLGSYLAQSEFGNFDPELHKGNYLKDFNIAPNQTHELEDKVMELHKTHKGQTPADAELHYLENAKKLAMYGVDLHPAKDNEGVDILLGICSQGLVVYKDKLRINRFAWPKILKISYKRQNFFIKLRPGECESVESTVGFKLASYRRAKKLWKTCVEHHTFFRLMTPEPVEARPKFLSLGSRYRYSGKTHYETKAATIDRPSPKFKRSLSGRHISSKSMDPIMASQLDETFGVNEAAKRHTMSHSPEQIPTIDEYPKKTKKDKLRLEDISSLSSVSSVEAEFPLPEDDDKNVLEEKPIGGIAVLPTGFGFGKSKKKEANDENKENISQDQSPSPLDGDTDQTFSEGELTLIDPEAEKSPDSPKKKGKSKSPSSLFSSTRSNRSKEREDVLNKENAEHHQKKSPLAVFMENRRSKEEKEKKAKKEKKEAEKKKKLDTSGSEGSSRPSSPQSPESALDRSIGEELRHSTGHTKEYEFTNEDYTTPKRPVQGFSYEKADKLKQEEPQSLSPTSGNKQTGLAFNYAPGEIAKVKKDAKQAIDYVESAARKEKAVELPAGKIQLADFVVDHKSGKILTGQIDLKTGDVNFQAIAEKAKHLDGKKQSPVKVLLSDKNRVYPGQIDSKTGEYRGYFDPVSGTFIPVILDHKLGNRLELTPSFRKGDNVKIIDVLIDPKSRKVLDGQIDFSVNTANNEKINSLLSNFDVSKAQPVKLAIFSDQKVLPGQIDPVTKEYRGCFDPKTGKYAPILGDGKPIISVNLIGNDNKNLEIANVLVDTRTGLIAENQIEHTGKINLGGIAKLLEDYDKKKFHEVKIVYNPMSYSILHGQVDLKTREYTGRLYPKTVSSRGVKEIAVALDSKTGKVAKNQIDSLGRLNYEAIADRYKNHDPNKQVFVPLLVLEESSTVLSGQITGENDYLGHYDPDTLLFVPVIVDLKNASFEEVHALNLNDVNFDDLSYVEVVVNSKTGLIRPGQISLDGKLQSANVAKLLNNLDARQDRKVKLLATHKGSQIVPGQVNPQNLKYLGYFDADSLLLIPVSEQIPEIPSNNLRFVEVKIDPKTGKVLGNQIDPKTAIVNENLIDLKTGYSKASHDSNRVLIVVDKSTKKVADGQLDLKHAKVISLVDPVTWEWCEVIYDSKRGKYVEELNIGQLDPVAGQLELLEDFELPELPKFESDHVQVVEVQIDPKTGKILDSVYDSKTGQLNDTKVNVTTGKLLRPLDPRKTLITHVLITKVGRQLLPGQIDPKSGKIVGRVDPNTFKLVQVDVDSKTGDLVEGKVKGQVNPNNGQVILYEIDKSGKLKDPKTGKVIEYEVDPTTGILIDPKTGQSLVGQITDVGGSITLPTLVHTADSELPENKQFPANFAAQGDKLSDEKQRQLDMNSELIQQEQKTSNLSGISAIFGKDDGKKKSKGKKEKVKKEKKESSESDSSSSSDLSEYEENSELKDAAKLKIPKLHIKGKKEKGGGEDKEKSPEKGVKTKIPKFSGWKSPTESKKAEEKSPESPKTSKIPGLSSLFHKKKSEGEAKEGDEGKKGPKVVKTTTKQLVVKDEQGVTENIEEKIEDLASGKVHLSTHVNKAEGSEDAVGAGSPYVTATAVTTRTATMHEDKGTKAKTSQVEEKTVAHSTTTSATRQEQRTVTQQVTSTTTHFTGTTDDIQQLMGRDHVEDLDSDDSGTNIDDEPSKGFPQGIVPTEKYLYTPTTNPANPTLTTSPPIVETEVRKVTLDSSEPDPSYTISGEIVSSQTISSKTRTVETITYKTEKDGIVETRVEQKITIQSDGDPVDHDRALAEAIQEATAMNPNMTVEKIEIQQQTGP